MQRTTAGSVPRQSVQGRSAAEIVAVVLTAVFSVGCDSGSSFRESASVAAAWRSRQALLAPIEECERAAGPDAQRLADCLRSSFPDLTPLTLSLLDRHRSFFDGESATPGIEALLEVVASEAEDPVLRAAARYYVAAGLMRSANSTRTEPEDRNARPPSALAAAMRRARDAQRAQARRRALNAAAGSLAGRAVGTTEIGGARRAALNAATGLSVGVEEAEFPGWGGPDVPTFAQAEADLTRSIRHGTVGATLPPGVTGTRLDGVQESLSDYRGRVVLLDFWATWCEPCVDVMPDLRELVAEMPADRFALIAISVDDQVETVTRFMEDEPMPWTNWHVGRGSDIGRLLRVRGYPTYVLVDEHGRILSRPRFGFASAVKEAVARLSPPA